MRRFLLAVLLVAVPHLAWGHPMPSSAVVLHVRRTAIAAEVTLPIVELALGWDRRVPGDADLAARQSGADLGDYLRDHFRPVAPDGRPWAVAIGAVVPVAGPEPALRVALTATPPPGAPVDRLTLRYDAIFHRLVTHTAVVTLAGDWRNGVLGEDPILLGTMRDTEPALTIDRSGGSWPRGFAAMVRLGARHIAEGTDHLLFLLTLLLPAPLAAAGGRWGGYAGGKAATRRIIAVVTAFTAGHSITLVLGVLGWVRLPAAAVESAIAGSILISAAHALVPILRGREAPIAGGFGLVHGLAFASTLAPLGLDPWTLAASVLGFNLGIEAVQVLIVLATMPWLVLLARSRAYTPIRVGAAAATGVAAAAWFGERAFGLANPIAPVVAGVAGHAAWLLGGIVALAVALAATRNSSAARREAGPPLSSSPP